MTLEERITRLEDIEAIRYLQAKYQRCLDTRDFDELASCFTEDVSTSYGNGSMSYEGKDAALGFLCNSMRIDMPSTHHIHGGEIDILDKTRAHAKWYLEDFLIIEKVDFNMHGAAIYDVDYEKQGEVWLIKKIGYTRCYEYAEKRNFPLEALKKTTYLDEVKNADPQTLGKYNAYFRSLIK